MIDSGTKLLDQGQSLRCRIVDFYTHTKYQFNLLGEARARAQEGTPCKLHSATRGLQCSQSVIDCDCIISHVFIPQSLILLSVFTLCRILYICTQELLMRFFYICKKKIMIENPTIQCHPERGWFSFYIGFLSMFLPYIVTGTFSCGFFLGHLTLHVKWLCDVHLYTQNKM